MKTYPPLQPSNGMSDKDKEKGLVSKGEMGQNKTYPI
jgi:hypothetical protein